MLSIFPSATVPVFVLVIQPCKVKLRLVIDLNVELVVFVNEILANIYRTILKVVFDPSTFSLQLKFKICLI